MCLIAITLMSGCTDWKKKYNALNVEHQNLQGLMDRQSTTIADLQSQINDQNKTPAQATGFDGYNVAFDPNAGTVTVTLDNAILFDAGKASLKSANSTELDHIYSVVQEKYPNSMIDVVGHTDSDQIKKSSWKDNWELSSQRALSVVRYLTNKGYPDELIRAVGRGDSQPIEPNTSAAGKAKNRRVEIVVHLN